ncbi:MAG: magnesium protoporphyrin IX methyltransferase [Pseudomonadota bacterium]
MADTNYRSQLDRLETYFDHTAVDAWKSLTSDAPVSRIRETVRAGRTSMQRALLFWLLDRGLANQKVLDAGCGTGTLSLAAARHGAIVTGVDLAAGLIDVAERNTPRDLQREDGSPAHRPEYRAGVCFAPDLGTFDAVVVMDVLIHYELADVVEILTGLAARTRRQIVFTFAPSTPQLQAMHLAGKVFPRADRAPAIKPVNAERLAAALRAAPALADAGWRIGRQRKISSGFYISQAMEIVRTVD